ncbi:A/B/D/E cyclin [Microthyrium microscopicum]|uniref:A/B/D/E cyclin n=1 Tax=Microthyrium microscopicum TaxID=703497 RepID=A0A6A6U6Z3_9PEZI|nr:A/B/D/E cyclin [Microthyrium microscopicum]
MAPKITAKRSLANENDENAVSTRVTRAKAAALDPSGADMKKPLVRTKSSANANATQARKRAALEDVSNFAKKDANGAKDAKKKPLGVKAGSVTNAARPTKVEKATRTTTKSVLTSKSINTKRPAPSSGAGHVTKKSRSTDSASKVVVQDDNVDENVAPQVESVKVEVKSQVKLETIVDEVDVDVRSDTEDAVEPIMEEDEIADLDAEDLDDPLMVAEYVNEIFDYLKELELQTMPNPNYMENQDDLEWQMRGILVDWLLEVHTRFRLLPETLFLAVNIIDRFLSAKVVQLDRLQLVGVTAMFIASKYEEVLSPHVSNFRHVADDGFTEEEILSAERFILTALNYDLSYPNPMNFLRRISKADNYDVQTRTLGKYLLEISCLDHRFIGHPPSRIAAASMYMARLILDRGEWDPTIAHYAGCTEEELLPCFHLMLDYLHGPVKHEAFFKKYAHKKFMKASVVVRPWVKQNAEFYLSQLPKSDPLHFKSRDKTR